MSDQIVNPIVTPVAAVKVNWPVIVLAVAVLAVATYLIFFRRLPLKKGVILSPPRKVQAPENS